MITFSALISALDQGGQWEMALDMYEKMRGMGIEANVVTHTSLISALGRGGWEEKLSRMRFHWDFGRFPL